MSESIVIVGAARTPMGGFQGDFSSLAAVSYTHLTLPTNREV